MDVDKAEATIGILRRITGAPRNRIHCLTTVVVDAKNLGDERDHRAREFDAELLLALRWLGSWRCCDGWPSSQVGL